MDRMDWTQQTMPLIQICQQKIEDFVLIIIKFHVDKFVVAAITIGEEWKMFELKVRFVLQSIKIKKIFKWNIVDIFHRISKFEEIYT